MADKVAAMAARRPSRDFVIIARTDARHVTGWDDMIARANLYREGRRRRDLPGGPARRRRVRALHEGVARTRRSRT
jgi:hypothetical protein